MGAIHFLAKAYVYTTVILTFLCGIGSLIFGIYFLFGTRVGLADNWLVIGSLVMAGVLIFLGIFGTVAAMFQKSVFFSIYALGLLLVLGLEIFLCVEAFSSSSTYTSEKIWSELNDSTRKEFQDWAECCGFYNLTDAIQPCFFRQTCRQKIDDHIINHLTVIKFSLIGFGILQIINIACVCFLAGKYHRDASAAPMKQAKLEEAREIRRQ